MSTQSRIDAAIERNRDELTKELLWIRINEGLTHLPWDKLGEVEKARVENTFEILIRAMDESYTQGYEDALCQSLNDIFNPDDPTL